MLLKIMALAAFAVNSASGSATPFLPLKIGLNNAFVHLSSSPSSSSSSSLNTKKDFADLRGGGKVASGDSGRALPGVVKWAYSAVGLATAAVSKSNIHYFLFLALESFVNTIVLVGFSPFRSCIVVLLRYMCII